MKKLNFLLAIVLVTGISFLSSCSKDTTTTPPTIMLNAGVGYTAADVTVPVNTELKVGVIAQSTGSKLTNLKISQTFSDSTSTLKELTFSLDSINRDFTITAPAEVGSLKLAFKITAADGESAEASFVITTTGSPINTYTAVLLGGQLNPDLGSFYSTGDNEVMKLAVARTNPAKADLVFYYGETLKASIVAISDPQLLGVPEFLETKDWSVRNATKFKLASDVDWATITTDASIAAVATNFTGTHINGLLISDIVAFETAATSSNPGKKGLYKVLEVNGTVGNNRSIKIEVKMQK